MNELEAALDQNNTASPSQQLGHECTAALHSGGGGGGGGSSVHRSSTHFHLLAAPSAYSLDLSPHLLYGVGPMISLLLGSGAHHYTEYKLIQGTVLRNMTTATTASSSSSQAQKQVVPSTRAEIFRDKTLTPLQKRSLMRFLKGCADAMDDRGPFVDKLSSGGAAATTTADAQSSSFKQLMNEEMLDDQLQRCLLHGVLLQHAALSTTATTLQGCEAIKLLRLYVASVGRYGIDAGPFLTPLYGCGELPQAFCRAAAVAGAVQVLRCGVTRLLFSDDDDDDDDSTTVQGECIGVELEGSGQILRGTAVAAGPSTLKEQIDASSCVPETVTTLRCIAILDAPVEVDMSQSLIVLPCSGPNGCTVWALQLGHSTAVCPAGQWVLHLWCCGCVNGNENENTAEEYLLPCLESLVAAAAAAAADNDTQSATILFSAFFSLKTTTIRKSNAETGEVAVPWPRNVTLCPGPFPDVTLASAVEAAKTCYWELFPPQSLSGSDCFPLDEAALVVVDDADENGDGGGDGGGGGADSDDEAVKALQSALGIGNDNEG